LPQDGLAGGWKGRQKQSRATRLGVYDVVIQSVPRHCLVDSEQEERKHKGNEERGEGERARRSGSLSLLSLSASVRIAELTSQLVGNTIKTASQARFCR
jgi:hypothetical protein